MEMLKSIKYKLKTHESNKIDWYLEINLPVTYNSNEKEKLLYDRNFHFQQCMVIKNKYNRIIEKQNKGHLIIRVEFLDEIIEQLQKISMVVKDAIKNNKIIEPIIKCIKNNI